MTKLIKTSFCIGLIAGFCMPVTEGRAQQGGVSITATRASAIHDCAVAAAKYLDYVWGNTEMFVYRACMAGRRQQE